MELEELKTMVDSALDKCQELINANTNVVLSEGDLERLLCKCISDEIHEDIQRPHDFSVHSQISHYFEEDGKNVVDYRVDILLLIESKLDAFLNHKEFKYEGDSLAIELKYLHRNDNIDRVKCDFCKWGSLRNDSWMYVVVLIDSFNDEDFTLKENGIKTMYNEECQKHNEHDEHLYYRVLKKKIQ